MAQASMADIFKYFSDNNTNGYTMATFRKDWAAMSDADKTHLKEGIGNGTLSY